MLLLSLNSSTGSSQEKLTQILDIADWGFSKISEIKYVATVVFEDKNGKHLLVYEMKRQAPLGTNKNPIQDLFAEKQPSHPVSLKQYKKAIWVWNTQEIINHFDKREIFLKFIKQQNFTDIYFQIPYKFYSNHGSWKTVWDSNNIRNLIAQIHQKRIQVHALDGDPRFALKSSHAKALNWVESVLEYNTEVSSNERFDGIHLDIEPHFLPNFYSHKKELILGEYLDLLKKISKLTREYHLKLGVDLPTTFDRHNDFLEPVASVDGKLFSQWVLDIVDEVTLMDYKTNTEGSHGIIEEAKQAIVYANKVGKKILIGLETAPNANELDETYYAYQGNLPFNDKNSTSQLFMKVIKGTQVQLERGRPLNSNLNQTEGARQFYQNSQELVPGDLISFAGKNKKQLKEAMEESAAAFSEFNSFDGFAIHSYESYLPWIRSKK